jgi:predicted RNase H-like HicB family nuclease
MKVTRSVALRSRDAGLRGNTEEEAMENIRDAIREYLAAIKETLPGADVREVEVTV